MSIYGSLLESAANTNYIDSDSIVNEAVKVYDPDKWGDSKTNKKFKGISVGIRNRKGSTKEDNENIAYTLEEDLKILEKNWNNILDKVAEEQQNYIDMSKDAGSDDKFYSKYNTIEKNKKSLKLSVVDYFGRREKKYISFSLVFHSPVADRDNHSIFVDEVIIDIETNKLTIPYITFEG